MVEAVGDIWHYVGHAVIAITTSGSVDRRGRSVMGRGVARQAAERFPGLEMVLGALVRREGNHVFYLGRGLASFPVEESAWSLPETAIISRSAEELSAMADRKGWQRIVVPRPGCGGGGLAWREVRPLLEPWFDDRFILISGPQ